MQIRQPWHAHFVMTAAAPSRLPHSAADPQVRTVCVVQADVSQTKRIVKNGKWYSRSQRWEMTLIDVRVLLGSADLKIEVWNDGRRLNADHDQVLIKWEKKLNGLAASGYSPTLLDRGLSPSTTKQSPQPRSPPSSNGDFGPPLNTVASRQFQRWSHG